MRLGRYTHDFKLDEETLVQLCVPFEVRLKLAEMLEATPDLIKAARRGGGKVELDDELLAAAAANFRMGTVVDLVFNYATQDGARCIVGWQGFEVPGEGEGYVPLAYSPENIVVLRNLLSWSQLSEIAGEAFRLAMEGNAAGSGSK